MRHAERIKSTGIRKNDLTEGNDVIQAEEQHVMPNNRLETCEPHSLTMTLQSGWGDAKQFGRLVRVDPPGTENENWINCQFKGLTKNINSIKAKTKQRRKKTSTPPAQIRRCDTDVVINAPSATEFGITFDEISVGEELCREHRTS